MREETSKVLESPSGNRADITVIIPACNEEEIIEKTIEHTTNTLKEIANGYELIIVDDGSKDHTYEKAQAFTLKDPRIKVVRNSVNMGKGFGVKHAAAHVTGRVVAVIDADMEIDPKQLQNYIRLLRKYDMCIASKWHPKSVYKAPVVRKMLSVAFNKLIRLIIGIKLVDTQTGLKAIRCEHFKKIMNTMLVKRYAYDVEILAIAQLLKLKIVELPVKIEQGSGFSIKAVMYMLIDLLGIAYRLRIKKWYQKNLDIERPTYKPLVRI